MHLDNYLICASARSGSNLLCELLASLGFAGKPFEHLWDAPGSTPEPLADRWPRILEAGRSDNGVFGTKLLWYQAAQLERELPALCGTPQATLGAVLTEVLGNPKYVYLTRRNRIRQAVSFARAIQSGQWRSLDAPATQPHYSTDAITQALKLIADEESNWEQFFARQAIAPYRLAYEDLDSEPRAALTGVLGFLGLAEPLPHSLTAPRHGRQADETTELWVQRYERASDRSPPS